MSRCARRAYSTRRSRRSGWRAARAFASPSTARCSAARIRTTWPNSSIPRCSSASRASRSRRASAISMRRGRMCSWGARQQAAVPRDLQAPRAGLPAPAWSFNHSSLFLDFLAGNQTYQCTPWSNPTYNVFGWQRPCYLLSDEGYAPTYRSLIEDTEWDKYGVGKQSAVRQLHGPLRIRGNGGQRCLQPSRSRRCGRRCSGPRSGGPDGARTAAQYTDGGRHGTVATVPIGDIKRIDRDSEESRGLAAPADYAAAGAGRDSGEQGSRSSSVDGIHPAAAEAFGAQLRPGGCAWSRHWRARLPAAEEVPARLHEAMRYSVLGGGKRVRPALVFATARDPGLARRPGRGGGLRDRTGPCVLAGP